jgi:hypothetical protein
MYVPFYGYIYCPPQLYLYIKKNKFSTCHSMQVSVGASSFQIDENGTVVGFIAVLESEGGGGGVTGVLKTFYIFIYSCLLAF